MRPTSLIVVALLAGACTVLAEEDNFVDTPTLSAASPIAPGEESPLALITPAPRHDFAIEQRGALEDGAYLTVHVQNNVSNTIGLLTLFHFFWVGNL